MNCIKKDTGIWRNHYHTSHQDRPRNQWVLVRFVEENNNFGFLGSNKVKEVYRYCDSVGDFIDKDSKIIYPDYWLETFD